MRCAIYTRKSVDEGLDAAFTTLDNQREYCSAYIASQAGEGWTELPQHYDDGGWSGGNLKRPALTQLRADIEAGMLDIVVVYKIDRLSRSLRDFANLVAEFEARKVTFVSVTQSFDTSTSMGRLTLNVLLSFAQFERELTGERLKDWFAGARGRGLWTRQRPFGYAKREGSHELIPHPTEAEIVRYIFERYPKLGSVRQMARELNAAGYLNSRGRPIAEGVVKWILHNRVYLGEMPHRGNFLPGIHEPIVDAITWRRAHRAMDNSRTTARARRREPVFAILKGLLFGPGGYAMIHYFARGRNGQIYRYYIARPQRQTGQRCPLGRLRAAEVERAVVALVVGLTGYRSENRYGLTDQAMAGLIRRVVARIDMTKSQMLVTLATGATIVAEVPGIMAPSPRGLAAQEMWRRKAEALSDSRA
ncbi:MAG: recombinase family protein [Rhizobiaceae bacterium]|nr:MAG: recombinase family protein [Rhizobiaceae bacterium]